MLFSDHMKCTKDDFASKFWNYPLEELGEEIGITKEDIVQWQTAKGWRRWSSDTSLHTDAYTWIALVKEKKITVGQLERLLIRQNFRSEVQKSTFEEFVRTGTIQQDI